MRRRSDSVSSLSGEISEEVLGQLESDQKQRAYFKSWEDYFFDVRVLICPWLADITSAREFFEKNDWREWIN